VGDGLAERAVPAVRGHPQPEASDHRREAALHRGEPPSYGEERIFAKEQALLDLVRDELAAGRPCVIYVRQTATRDIQPRLERLLREHVPAARTYILANSVEAQRREAVIEREIARGANVVLCNPELVKTGLDLIHFPTLIFHEIVFNLSTMMQAAARSYRLNQTHAHCKVVYLFAEGTMEHAAVQLMSRKQRAPPSCSPATSG
jgi:SNF2 family DNA or RNA helicase